MNDKKSAREAGKLTEDFYPFLYSKSNATV